ncbi:MAG: hypothetical protein ICV52_00960 [Microcoleus sp. C1-bin4]|nr:hypothetical protein [Microcoleus sp. C1-bin4]
MSKILHRLAMAALGTAAISTINTLNNLTEASATAKFDGVEISQEGVGQLALPSPFNK